MLLRLLGLVARQEPALARTALMAAGRLCDFESPCRNATLAAMAVVAEACEEEMRTEVIRALTKIAVFKSETEHSAMDVALTLVEAAAQQPSSHAELPALLHHRHLQLAAGGQLDFASGEGGHASRSCRHYCRSGQRVRGQLAAQGGCCSNAQASCKCQQRPLSVLCMTHGGADCCM